MFKFSFDIEPFNDELESIDSNQKRDGIKSDVTSPAPTTTNDSICDKEPPPIEEDEKKCEELILDKNLLDEYERDLIMDVSEISIFKCKQRMIKYLGADTIRYDDKIIIPLENYSNINNCSSGGGLEMAELKNSDLLPGIYEGGAKIWECTQDLANYLLENDELDFKEKCVLDLGCGAGILGIVALDLNSKTVHFQDYNKEILEMITIKNILLNFKIKSNDDDDDVDDDDDDDEDENENKEDKDDDGGKLCREQMDNAFITMQENIFDKCKFYAGDWNSYAENKTTNNDSSTIQFDIILSSETLYNPKNYLKILNLLKLKLKPDGYALFAAKTYYFGIGGSIREFQQLLFKDGTFESTVIWQTNENVKREILRINFIQ